MNTPGGPGEPGGLGEQPAFSAGDLAEVRAVLRAALAWNLSPARWAEVDEALAGLAAALASGDHAALRSQVTTLELLGPVRQVSRSAATLPAPGQVQSQLRAAIAVIERLEMAEWAAEETFPIAVYLTEGSIHDQVELALDRLLRAAGLHVIERQEPISGSWFRRMRASVDAAARTGKGQEVVLSAMHAADARFFLRQDAELTTLLLQNLAPVITALQPTKDAVIRAGALLIVKVDWVVAVHQLTQRQQLMLDHAPDLESAPHQILKALGIAGAEAGSPTMHDLPYLPGKDGENWAT
jgi:hypothetical protein